MLKTEDYSKKTGLLILFMIGNVILFSACQGEDLSPCEKARQYTEQCTGITLDFSLCDEEAAKRIQNATCKQLKNTDGKADLFDWLPDLRRPQTCTVRGTFIGCESASISCILGNVNHDYKISKEQRNERTVNIYRGYYNIPCQSPAFEGYKIPFCAPDLFPPQFSFVIQVQRTQLAWGQKEVCSQIAHEIVDTFTKQNPWRCQNVVDLASQEYGFFSPNMVPKALQRSSNYKYREIDEAPGREYEGAYPDYYRQISVCVP